MKLKGKRAVITGASKGLGRALALRFAAEGARLVLQYRRGRTRIGALQKELHASDPLLVCADLRSEKETKRLFCQAVEHFGRVDTLIANAGSWETRDVPLHQMPLRQWQSTLESVLTTTFLSVREFLRLVAKQKSGNAVLIASTAAVFGEAGHADYSAAKAGMAYGLTRSLKNELARLAPHTQHYCGGRINCICPGWTVVPRTAAKLCDPVIARKVTATMALPQLGRPDDMAHAAVFLASDTLARHITGQTLVIAGGMEGRWLWQPHETDASIV